MDTTMRTESESRTPAKVLQNLRNPSIHYFESIGSTYTCTRLYVGGATRAMGSDHGRIGEMAV